MAAIVSRVYDALGVLLGEETIDVPDAPTAPVDLPTVAEQLQRLTGVVDELILAQLMAGMAMGDFDLDALNSGSL